MIFLAKLWRQSRSNEEFYEAVSTTDESPQGGKNGPSSTRKRIAARWLEEEDNEEEDLEEDESLSSNEHEDDNEEKEREKALVFNTTSMRRRKPWTFRRVWKGCQRLPHSPVKWLYLLVLGVTSALLGYLRFELCCFNSVFLYCSYLCCLYCVDSCFI